MIEAARAASVSMALLQSLPDQQAKYSTAFARLRITRISGEGPDRDEEDRTLLEGSDDFLELHVPVVAAQEALVELGAKTFAEALKLADQALVVVKSRVPFDPLEPIRRGNYLQRVEKVLTPDVVAKINSVALSEVLTQTAALARGDHRRLPHRSARVRRAPPRARAAGASLPARVRLAPRVPRAPRGRIL